MSFSTTPAYVPDVSAYFYRVGEGETNLAVIAAKFDVQMPVMSTGTGIKLNPGDIVVINRKDRRLELL